MIELINIKTGKIIARYNYDFDEFIKHKYGRLFSLLLDERVILGDSFPEFVWRKATKTQD